MDRLYSPKSLFSKAAFCFFLPWVHQLITSGSLSSSVLWLFASTVLIGCLYTIPFWISLVAVHRQRVVKIGRYVLMDLLCCFAPAVVASLAFEIYTLFTSASDLAGLYTLLISAIFLLISGIFWLLYLVTGKHTRP